MTEPETKSDQPPFLHDSYLAWCEEQPVPVVENFGIGKVIKYSNIIVMIKTLTIG